MTSAIWMRDLLSFWLQLALVIATAAALCRLFRIRDPRAALGYWRTLLMACLLLPALQPWTTTAVPRAASASTPPAASVAVAGFAAEIPAAAAPRSVSDLLLLLVVLGIAARSMWLILGAWSLRRLRRGASLAAPLPATLEETQTRIGARADVYLSDRIAGPITFGVIHPVIIVPRSVLSTGPEVQRAILCHELLHVRRGDWLRQIVEEGVRTIFWCHPAVWWLIGRIQLSREQVVDREVIRLTESRDHYIEALLVVARSRSPRALVPAPLFLRRRFLKSRIAQMFQENTMTTRRLIASLAASAVALAMAATLAARAFPLQAQKPDANAAPIQIVKGGENLLHGSLAEYPRRAFEQHVEGEVILDLTVDDRGEVSDARVVAGPDELRRAALESVLQWHYSPAVRATSIQAVLQFHLPAAMAAENYFEGKRYVVALTERSEKGEPSPAQRAERQMMEIERALADPAITEPQREVLKHEYAETRERLEKIRAERGPSEGKEPRFDGTPRLSQIRSERLNQSVVHELISRAGVHIGDPFTEETAKRIREIAASIDEHLRVGFGSDKKGGIILSIVGP